MDWTTIENAFYQWAVDTTGIDVIWSYPSRPRRNYPFIVLDMESVTQAGPDYRHYIDNGTDLDVCILGRRTIRLNAQAFTNDMRPSGNGRFYLERLAMGVKYPAVAQALLDANLAIAYAQPNIKIDTHLESEWKSRWSQDFIFNAVVELQAPETASFIDTLDVINEGPEPDENLIIGD